MADKDNIVSAPPLQTAVLDNNGFMSRAWAVFFRDIYNRTSYKGGNAIDTNANGLLSLNSTLQDTISNVNTNTANITTNSENIAASAEQIAINAETIEANKVEFDEHAAAEEAHGSNGVIVGFGDLADETTVGLVKRMAAIANASNSLVNIGTADIAAAPAAYNQAYIQTIATLTNENKAAINQLATDLNAAISVLNDLLAQSKSSGQMTT